MNRNRTKAPQKKNYEQPEHTESINIMYYDYDAILGLF